MWTVVTSRGCVPNLAVEEIRALLGREENVWIDLSDPGEAAYRLLSETLHFHPLTIEDIQHGHQRPKVEEYDGYRFAVLFLARWHDHQLDFGDVYVYLTPRVVVTVHQGAEPSLDALKDRASQHQTEIARRPGFLSYLVVDAIVDELFPVLDQLDDLIDDVEDQVASRATTTDLTDLTRLKHDVVDLRRRLGAQRDLFQRLLMAEATGPENELSPYFRDVYDHVVRQYEIVDSLRDVLSGALDIYLSTVSNRLNITVKQLTVIASLFLPLSFLTGFFGMNFTFLTDRIQTPLSFFLALLLMAGAMALQLYVLRWRGWL
ncbi:MAG TPA: magnesium/cobalt transporter CorA [Chloroflexota bacterium]|nr:magnesium/cobalt transporter CorA [Chloroflexota bacterium]